jgi:hypothetical protein
MAINVYPLPSTLYGDLECSTSTCEHHTQCSELLAHLYESVRSGVFFVVPVEPFHQYALCN